MARSAEKAMTALARWRAVYVDKVQDQKRRPFQVTECTSLKDALYYRRQIVHDISRKIAQIQNPSLGEYKLRDLNDDINKLVREKGHWEDHIKNLGGPDFKAEAPKMLEKEGKEVPGNRGYRYYGAARDLPGVRELFEEEPQPVVKKSRGELMKMIDVSYYGNCDEDDGVIVPQEMKYEQEYMARKAAEWKARRDNSNRKNSTADENIANDDDADELDEDNADAKNIYAAGDNPADDEIMRLYEAIDMDERSSMNNLPTAAQLTALGAEDEAEEEDEYIAMLNSRVSGKTMSSLGNIKRAFVAHVPVYTQQQVEASLLAQKKREILEKYMSEELIASMTETGEILGMDDRSTTESLTTGKEDVLTSPHQASGEQNEEEDEREDEENNS